MKLSSSAFIVLIVLGLLAQVTGAQEPRPQVTFRAGVDYVRLNVVVTDNDDRPVPNLTKDDFEVIERGRPQKIDECEFVSIPARPGGSKPDILSVAPADVATNAPASATSRVFVLVIDDLHILESDIIDVKRVMTEFIRGLPADDEVAVVFVRRSDLSQNFTSDRALLMRTVDRVRDALGFGLDALGKSNTSNLIQGNSREILRYAQAADYVLMNVANALAGSQHSRRAIVYVSGGSVSPTTPTPGGRYPSDFEDLRNAYEAARRAGVPIYTLDPRGMVLPSDAVRGGMGTSPTASDPVNGRPAGSQRPDAAVQQAALIRANIKQQQERLSEIAVVTGGRAFTNQSDLTKAVREIVSDNSSYYVLGYYPSPSESDGKFHQVSVKVKRPGTRVRAQAGYLASTSQAAAGDVKAMLADALGAGVNVSALTLRAFAAPLVTTAKGMRTLVTVEVTYPVATKDVRQIEDDFNVTVLALDPDAKVRGSSDKAWRFKGVATDDRVVRILLHDVIELPSQPLTLRIGVASRVLGKAGTVQMSVDVPDPTESKLRLSGVVVGTGSGVLDALGDEAIAPLVPFQPTVTRTFARADTLRIFGHVLWRSRDAPSVTMAVRTVVSSKQSLTLATSPDTSGNQDGRFDATISLATLAPGNYVLEIVAQARTGKPVSREVPFVVR